MKKAIFILVLSLFSIVGFGQPQITKYSDNTIDTTFLGWSIDTVYICTVDASIVFDGHVSYASLYYEEEVNCLTNKFNILKIMEKVIISIMSVITGIWVIIWFTYGLVDSTDEILKQFNKKKKEPSLFAKFGKYSFGAILFLTFVLIIFKVYGLF